jgi:hypothetical protein
MSATMSEVFYRLDLDQRVTPLAIGDFYGGPQPSACWLIGGGPSLNQLDCAAIAQSPLPKMTLNLAGVGHLRPDFWTSYDPTARFHRSLYLDPSVFKFVHRRRAMDLVPDTTFKVCECPGMIFFDRETGRGFQNVLDPASRKIVDWADSMMQGIDLLYRLGFRRIYLAGCDLRVLPSAAYLAIAEQVGLPRSMWWSITDFVDRCAERGVSRADLERLAAIEVYHFPETKPLAAAMATDGHYYRMVQGLRLSRRCLSRCGVELISVTPDSRLNAFFPYRPVSDVIAEIHQSVGNPALESTVGCYAQQGATWVAHLEPMRDIKPPNWPGGPHTPAAAVVPPPAVEPELLIEDEGWVGCGNRFREAYVDPVEEG